MENACATVKATAHPQTRVIEKDECEDCNRLGVDVCARYRFYKRTARSQVHAIRKEFCSGPVGQFCGIVATAHAFLHLHTSFLHNMSGRGSQQPTMTCYIAQVSPLLFVDGPKLVFASFRIELRCINSNGNVEKGWASASMGPE